MRREAESKPIAAPIVGGMITSTINVLILFPVFFVMMKARGEALEPLHTGNNERLLSATGNDSRCVRRLPKRNDANPIEAFGISRGTYYRRRAKAAQQAAVAPADPEEKGPDYRLGA